MSFRRLVVLFAHTFSSVVLFYWILIRETPEQSCEKQKRPRAQNRRFREGKQE